MKSFKIGDLTIKLPIIQGGMGVGISLSGLASAVANEGGVGVISCAGMGLLYPKFSKDYLTNSIMGLKEEIRKAARKTRGVIGVNVMVALSNFSDMVKHRSRRRPISSSPAYCRRPAVLLYSGRAPRNWCPRLARAAKIIAKNGKRTTTTCPTPSSSKVQRAVTSAIKQPDRRQLLAGTHIVPEVVAEARHFEKLYGPAASR